MFSPLLDSAFNIFRSAKEVHFSGPSSQSPSEANSVISAGCPLWNIEGSVTFHVLQIKRAGTVGLAEQSEGLGPIETHTATAYKNSMKQLAQDDAEISALGAHGGKSHTINNTTTQTGKTTKTRTEYASNTNCRQSVQC